MSQLFTAGGQSIGALALSPVLLMNIQDLFPLGLIGLISLLSEDSQDSSPAPQFKSINSSPLSLLWASPVAQLVENPSAMQEAQETRIQSLSWKDPLEEGMATHSGILAWRIPLTEEPGGLQSIGSQ